MIKLLKYVYLLNLYNKSKRNIFILFGSLVAMLLVSFILNDLISVSDGINAYIYILVKWLIMIALICLFVYNLFVLLNKAMNPMQSTKKSKEQDSKSSQIKKQRILEKEELMSQSDKIIQKYMK